MTRTSLRQARQVAMAGFCIWAIGLFLAVACDPTTGTGTPTAAVDSPTPALSTAAATPLPSATHGTALAPVPSQIPFPTARPPTSVPTLRATVPGAASGLTTPVLRQQEIPLPPAKDVYELGRRLLLKSAERPPRFTDPPPPPLVEGDELDMWVDRDRGVVNTRAIVARVSANAYWLFDRDVEYDEGDLKGAVDEFERNIWPTVTNTFGPILTPGVDSDPRLVILHTRVRSGVGGYFSGADSYPRSIQKFSNEREIIYISSSGLSLGSRLYLGTLTHELQHASQFAADPDEDTWVNEGMSELAAELAGYRSLSISDYLRRPSVSLTEWAKDIGSAGPNYGAAALFMEYVVDHYGGPAAARAIVAEPADGLGSINVYLSAAGYEERALDVFRSWLVANYLDDDSGPYSYPRRDLKSGVRLLTEFVLTPTTIDGSVDPLGADFYSVSLGSGSVSLEFEGQPSAELFPVSPLSGETCWWGNAGDSIDSTLTRRVDFTRLAPEIAASIDYGIWHDIEEEFDFAYVEVSTDGGSTWTVLPATGTTDSDPNGASYGHGYTGTSDGWSRQSVDLSAYAGQSFLLRFEYITDDAVHGRGLCLDDFAIRATTWADDTETDGDWVADGFARVNNNIPQDYLLLMVRQVPGSPATVAQVQVGAAGRAHAEVPGLAANERLAVIVSPVTAGTSGPAMYTLSVAR